MNKNSIKYTIKFNEKYIRHYTCNPPKKKILDKYSILPVGNVYGLEDRELLFIPIDLCKNMFGKDIEKYFVYEDSEDKEKSPLISFCEHLLKRIEK